MSSGHGHEAQELRPCNLVGLSNSLISLNLRPHLENGVTATVSQGCWDSAKCHGTSQTLWSLKVYFRCDSEGQTWEKSWVSQSAHSCSMSRAGRRQQSSNGPLWVCFCSGHVYDAFHSIVMCWIWTTGTGGRRPGFLPKAAELAVLWLEVPDQVEKPISPSLSNPTYDNKNLSRCIEFLSF